MRLKECSSHETWRFAGVAAGTCTLEVGFHREDIVDTWMRYICRYFVYHRISDRPPIGGTGGYPE